MIKLPCLIKTHHMKIIMCLFLSLLFPASHALSDENASDVFEEFNSPPKLSSEAEENEKPIRVKMYVIAGSVWDSDAGGNLIQQEVVESRRIWFANAGVKLSLLPKITRMDGPVNDLTGQDIKTYAGNLGAEARNIVVVFTNRSLSISRAWTEPSLVTANTPVIIVGREVFDNPGTKRDLAHEIGHVLLRDASHTDGWSNLMNIGKNIGDYVSENQKTKAKNYPY